MKYFRLLSGLCLSALVLLVSCDSGGKTFRVKGDITSADGKTVYLERRGLGGVEVLDSVKLKSGGAFSFKAGAPENPEFYQLRVDGQLAVFTVDSTQTLQVKADAASLATTFEVENSPVNEQLKQIGMQQVIVSKKIKEIDAAHKNKSIDDIVYLAELDSALNNYKTFATNLILANPSGGAAYYALFQKVDEYLIFNPFDKKDYAMFAAVATSWSQRYPETPRSKHLYDFTMGALKARKQEEKRAALLENIPFEENASLPDIVLPNLNGQKMSLASLKGKVVILDFTVYKSEFSAEHNLALNKVYNQAKAKGVEIYQISFDSDEHFWKNASINVPWVAVRDAQSVNSGLLSAYNVRNLPTAFIINREGDISARVEDYSRLQQELNKVL